MRPHASPALLPCRNAAQKFRQTRIGLQLDQQHMGLRQIARYADAGLQFRGLLMPTLGAPLVQERLQSLDAVAQSLGKNTHTVLAFKAVRRSLRAFELAVQAGNTRPRPVAK